MIEIISCFISESARNGILKQESNCILTYRFFEKSSELEITIQPTRPYISLALNQGNPSFVSETYRVKIENKQKVVQRLRRFLNEEADTLRRQGYNVFGIPEDPTVN